MRNFEEVYKRIQEKYSKKFEKIRKKNKIFFIISLMLVIFIFLHVINNLIKINVNILIFELIIATTIFIIAVRKKARFEHDFKSNIINELIKEFDNGLNYYIKGGISKQTFDDSGFKIEYTHIESEDVIKGKIKENINMQMGEIKLISQKKDENGNYEKTTMYNGMFAEMILPIENNIPKITIRKKVPMSYETKTFQKVELESAEFSEKYDFYTENPIEALQIFTIDAVEKILNIREKYKKNIEFILKGNKICMIFDTYKPFEIRINKKTLDYNLLKEYYEIIEMVGNIGIYFNEILNEKNLI